MNCPVCACETSVVDSRPMPYGIRRRRKCDVCTNKFSTVEMRVGAIPSEEFARLAARFYQEAVALVTKNNEIENSVNKWVTK